MKTSEMVLSRKPGPASAVRAAPGYKAVTKPAGDHKNLQRNGAICVTAEERFRLISAIAYFRAAHRGPVGEATWQAEWVAAENEINNLLK